MKTCTSLLISEHALSNNACYKNNILLKSTGQHPPSIKTNIINHELTLIILLNRIISCRRIPSVWPQFPSIAQSMPLSKPSPVHKPTESFLTPCQRSVTTMIGHSIVNDGHINILISSLQVYLQNMTIIDIHSILSGLSRIFTPAEILRHFWSRKKMVA